MMRILFGWLIVSLTLSASLPRAISSMMTRNKINPSTVSLLISETDSGKIIASQTPNQSRIPASVMKVLTTYSALVDLGPTFRWPTKFYYTGGFSKGTIQGNLVVEAFGDPTLTSRELRNIAKRLRKLGVRKIQGDMILDRTFFADNHKVTSGFDRNRYSAYNAMPDALMLDDHMSHFTVRPQNGSIDVVKTIPNDAYDLVNRIKPFAGACKGKHAWPYIGIKKEGDRPVVIVSGNLSTRCPKRTFSRLITYAHESFYYAFRSALKQAGIIFDGKMVLAPVPANVRALMIHHARPLLQIVAKTNK